MELKLIITFNYLFFGLKYKQSQFLKSSGTKSRILKSSGTMKDKPLTGDVFKNSFRVKKRIQIEILFSLLFATHVVSGIS